jgi:Flp pilus assembly protein TadG
MLDRTRSWSGRDAHRGQGLVEFALVFTIFMVLVMAVVDLGRGIYAYNGVAQAAREIARVTSVYPGSPLGNSSQTQAVVVTQRQLVPTLGTPTFSCVDIDDTAVSGSCGTHDGDRVKVNVHASWQAVSPLLGILGSFDFQSTSSVEVTNVP